MDILNILGNENRRNILKLLFKGDLHINEIARRLNVSVPVVLKHVEMLEQNSLIERNKIGSIHMLRINSEYIATVKKIFDAIEKAYVIKAKKGHNLLDVLSKISEIGLQKTKDGYFVESIDGKKGYFLFELNGKIPNKSIEKIVLNEDSEISFYHLTPVLGRRFAINLE